MRFSQGIELKCFSLRLQNRLRQTSSNFEPASRKSQFLPCFFLLEKKKRFFFLEPRFLWSSIEPARCSGLSNAKNCFTIFLFLEKTFPHGRKEVQACDVEQESYKGKALEISHIQDQTFEKIIKKN